MILINWWSSALLVLFWSRSWLGAWSWLQFAVRHLKEKIKFFESTLVDGLSDTEPAQFATVRANDHFESEWMPNSSDFNLKSSSGRPVRFGTALKSFFSNFQSTIRSDALLEASLPSKSRRLCAVLKRSAARSPSRTDRNEELLCYQLISHRNSPLVS